MQEEVPNTFKETCFVVKDVFSQEECNKLIQRMQEIPEKIDTTEENIRRVVQRSQLKVIKKLNKILKKIKTEYLSLGP